MLSFLIGGGIALAIGMGGGPEALGAILPMIVIGIIHLFGGPVASHYAYKSHQFKKSILVYFYFIFFIVFAFIVVGPEAIIYYLLFIIFMIIPIIYSGIMTFFRMQK